jgi:hypothetical protein
MSTSTRTFFLLIILLAVLTAANLFLPQGTQGTQGLPGSPNLVPAQGKLPASLPVVVLVIFAMILVVYGGLGFVGVKLSRKLGIPDLLSPDISNRERFGMPALAGASIGLFLILADFIFNRFLAVDRLPHPPFPTSLLASVSAGIGEEILFRLFFITFWTWLVSYVLLRRKGFTPVYWVVSTFSAAAFSASHFPALMTLQNVTSLSQFSPALIVELFLLNGALSLAAAYYFKKAGYLAAAGVHFWADLVWHVVWGLV